MKNIAYIGLLCIVTWTVAVHAESLVLAPRGKVSFSLRVPKDSVNDLKPGQRVTVRASNGQKGKYDPAPVVEGAIVLEGIILEVGSKVQRDGFVTLAIAVTPSEDQNLKNAQAQKADLTIEALPSQ